MNKTQQLPLMSIVVLNWNGLDDTKICLEHLNKLDYPNYEIIVVDNGSRPDQKEYLRQRRDIILVDNPVNRGFTGGHIDGLAKAKGEFVVLLNNDAVMQSNYLREALTYFEDPAVAAVGGRSYFWNDDQPILDETNAFYAYQTINVQTGEAFMASSDFGVPQVVNNVSGSAVVMRRSVINEIGYLYDRFFAYFEETDLFARVKRAGYKVVYSPDLHIWHRNGASSGASSGSHFFYYQIFRNRFIFAMRNFETRPLLRFVYIYSRIALGSLARWILRPHSPNQTMYRAYAKAAWYNLRTIGTAIQARRQLTKQLGASNYNHHIYSEQTGVSIVVDCTKLGTKALATVRQQLAADTDPLHEYVLVVATGNYSPDFDTLQPNVRYVQDRGYFDRHSLNLGVIAARFDWVMLCDAQSVPSVDSIRAALWQTFDSSAQAVGIGSPAVHNHAVLLHRELFTYMGGVGTPASMPAIVQDILTYATRAKRLVWLTQVDTTKPTAALSLPGTDELRTLDTRLRRDRAYQHAHRVTWLGRLKNRYSRLHQIGQLVHWLFIPRITLYLKAARIKNLLLFSATLNRPKLALELKHIRNEVILNTSSGIDVSLQQQVTKDQLAHLAKHPTDMPVFIICRDRVDSLKVLVAWLEQHGLKQIVFIDNDSVYPPLVSYLQQTPYQVLRLYRNVGHTSPWALGAVRALVPEGFYIVTDPDVIPIEDCPADVLQHFLALHEQYFVYQKVGFGLRIDDLPDHYPLKQSVIDWESQFWTKAIGPEVYEAGVDTTFAMYKPFSYDYVLHPSVRTGKPYVARHVPWYLDPAHISEEERHYRFRADHNVSSWNADQLEERYAKEMKKSKK
jgi:GT2 family glycosyltransferase